jgi:hypothetical protein
VAKAAVTPDGTPVAEKLTSPKRRPTPLFATRDMGWFHAFSPTARVNAGTDAESVKLGAFTVSAMVEELDRAPDVPVTVTT